MTSTTNGPAKRIGSALDAVLLRGGLLLSAAFLFSALTGWTEARARATAVSRTASAEAVAAHLAGTFDSKIDRARDDMRVMRAALEQRLVIDGYAKRYRIPHELARAIHDAAVDAGIQPAIGFRLVQVESNFKRTARSTASAFGYTQVQVPTARHYDPDVTEQDLYDRDTNLRLGFRYLKDLLQMFHGDMHLALLAYNRGPGRVEQILAEGGDPRNGYSSAVLRGAKGPVVQLRGT